MSAAGPSILRAFVAFRVAAVLLVGVMAATMTPTPLMAVAAVESIALVVLAWRTGRLSPAVVVGDGLFLAAVLAVDIALTADPATLSYDKWAFHYALPVSVSIGLAAGRLGLALAAVLPALVAIAASGPAAGLTVGYRLFDVATALVDAGVGAFAARAVHTRAAQAEAARQATAAAEAELARERARAAHARILHDRVLQTMEALARGEPALRKHVVAEAAWLRDLIAGPRPQGLADAADRARRLGLGVELSLHGDPQVPDQVTEAVRRCLVELAERDGRGRAVVHAEVERGELVVSVVHGGEPTSWLPEGASVVYTPGEGTEVELRVSR